MTKKKYQIIKATTKEITGLTVGGKFKKFGSNGVIETYDAGEAKEIDKVLGARATGEVVVTSYKEKEQGHTYTFGAMTSKNAEDFWKRYEKKKKNLKKRKKRRVSNSRRLNDTDIQ